MRPITIAPLVLSFAVASAAHAQEVFRSVQSANLPTAEILAQGSWLFEISHRFNTPVSEGASALWGFDGPVFNRLGLAYSATDRVQLGILRTNAEDNVELNAKVALWSSGDGGVPTKLAFMGGVAFNTQPFPFPGAEDNESQQYAQLIVNALLGDRFAVGVVPTYLRNQRLADFDVHQAVAVGLHGQLFLSPDLGLLGEWLVTPERTDLEHDPVTFGLEATTRGHVFKLVVTNQARMNPTQVLAGSEVEFTPDEWRVGFNITRLLPF
ncbi:MAG: hypothetical protein FJ207_02155 [Gemmatimonadetes bacterium]|nr:hypothetical protein [Gemmatimonadota bacterium]